METSALPETVTQALCKWAERRGTIRNRVSIDEQPEIVEQKTRIEDWEGDTVIGKNHQ